jgi:hypothetical protein
MKNWIVCYRLSKNSLCLRGKSNGRYLLLALFLSLMIFSIQAQDTIPTKEKKEKPKKERKIRKPKDPHKATLWALIPGAGQIYNQRYWKLPIVYAGFGVTTYFIIANRQEYIKYNNAYICSSKEDNSQDGFVCDDPLGQKYSTTDLQTFRDYYRRNLELSFIATAAWYVLQMLDATVDAHLTHWNVDDDLTVEVEPVIRTVAPLPSVPLYQPAYNGIRITMNF